MTNQKNDNLIYKTKYKITKDRKIVPQCLQSRVLQTDKTIYLIMRCIKLGCTSVWNESVCCRRSSHTFAGGFLSSWQKKKENNHEHFSSSKTSLVSHDHRMFTLVFLISLILSSFSISMRLLTFHVRH